MIEKQSKTRENLRIIKNIDFFRKIKKEKDFCMHCRICHLDNSIISIIGDCRIDLFLIDLRHTR